jgi:hypothetical protein
MARTVRNSKLDTRSARAKLEQRREPYWAPISPGCALGYRRGAKGGTWIARYRPAVGGRRYLSLGAAHDVFDPDGRTALSFSQAQERTPAWFSDVAREISGEVESARPYRVADAARDYLQWFKDSRKKSVREVEYNLHSFIVPPLGQCEVALLTAPQIRAWLSGIASKPPRLRTRRGDEQRYRATSGDPEALRRRRATANHILTSLKAALNHAYREG